MSNILILLSICSVGLSQLRLEEPKVISLGYSLEKSKALFFYSQASRCDPDAITTWTCGTFCDTHPGMTDIKFFNNQSNHGQAYCGYNKVEKQIVLSFRSSQKIKNLLNGIKILPTKYPLCDKCYVHTGFYSTFKDIQDDIAQCALDLKQKYPSSQITAVGHSLGGALAIFSVLDLKNRGLSVDNLYTYGCPRLGNQAFVTYVDSLKIPYKFRITHNKDMMVHFPPSIMGYRHITQEVWYNEDSSSFTMCDATNSEDKKCALSTLGSSLKDHLNYHGNVLDCGIPLISDTE